jgi:hypothetical protein
MDILEASIYFILVFCFTLIVILGFVATYLYVGAVGVSILGFVSLAYLAFLIYRYYEYRKPYR